MMFCHRQQGCVCIKILWANFCYEITWIDLAFWLQISINTDTPLVSAAFIVLLTLHDTSIFSLCLESSTVSIEKSIPILVYTAKNSVYEHIHTSIILEVSSASVIITSATTEADFLSKTPTLPVLVRWTTIRNFLDDLFVFVSACGKKIKFQLELELVSPSPCLQTLATCFANHSHLPPPP